MTSLAGRNFLLITALLLGPAACSSSSSGGSGNESDAVSKCNAYVDAFCAKTEECTTQKGTAVTKADCKSQAAQIIDCSKSKAVTENYPACITDLKTLDCAQTNAQGAISPLPASCSGTILQSIDPSGGAE